MSVCDEISENKELVSNISELMDKTNDTDNEHGANICRIDDKIILDNECVGTKCAITIDKPCDSPGKEIGHIHTHPGGNQMASGADIANLFVTMKSNISCTLTDNILDKRMLTCFKLYRDNPKLPDIIRYNDDNADVREDWNNIVDSHNKNLKSWKSKVKLVDILKPGSHKDLVESEIVQLRSSINKDKEHLDKLRSVNNNINSHIKHYKKYPIENMHYVGICTLDIKK